MVMNFNARAAKQAVSEHKNYKYKTALAAAEAIVSSAEKAIKLHASMGKTSYSIRVESHSVFTLVWQILEENGFLTSSKDGKTIILMW